MNVISRIICRLEKRAIRDTRFYFAMAELLLRARQTPDPRPLATEAEKTEWQQRARVLMAQIDRMHALGVRWGYFPWKDTK